tara:strand:- start:33490 stop:34227 length:738 start_codon:yes stop_codon:yes gene_type:complete
MKKYLNIYFIIFIGLVLIVPISGANPDSETPLLDGDVTEVNSIAYTKADLVNAALTEMHTTAYSKQKLGDIKISNNNPEGYKIDVKSTNAFNSSLDGGGAYQKPSFLVHSDFDYNVTSPSNNKHRNIEGAFIDYSITIWPKGHVDGAQSNDYGVAGTAGLNYHGCFASPTDAVNASAIALYLEEQALNSTSTMTFDLTATPCINRTGGIVGTVDYEYDILITTVAKKQLLSGDFGDTITITITDL